MLSIESYIQNSMSSVSGKVCAVARLIAFASIAVSFDIDTTQASGLGAGLVRPGISEAILVENDDHAKQLDYWHQHNA